MSGAETTQTASMSAGAQRVLASLTSAKSSLDIARSLGWSDNNLHQREVRRGETRLDVSRGFVGGQPAAMFATVAARNGFDPLDSAALYAYHASVDWGMLVDVSGLTIFNAHRVTDSNWFRLPRINWHDLEANSEILQSLTPEGIISGAIERFASRYRVPTDLLSPVDDELVKRLDKWRDQALRYARDAQSVDERLQTFYAQLFVLRTVEDRGLDSSVPLASSIVMDSEHIDWKAWSDLIAKARDQIGSDLFDRDVAADLPEHVIAGVVHDLYFPHGLPSANARYNFAWIEADVLGLAYEKYLSSVLQPAPPLSQFEIFLPPEREVERLSVRKQSGAYYTPKFIRDFLAAKCVDDFFSRSDANTFPKVIDFACGSGSFLVSAIDQILRYVKSQDPNRSWARDLIEGGFIVGIDVDPKAITTARLHVWQRLVEEPDALPLPNLSRFFISADGLKTDTWGELRGKYDIVLGNPPFLSTSLISNREELESRFITARGRYDFSSLFVEQAIHLLNEGGLMGMVVPNRLYRNRNAKPVRELLVRYGDLLTLVDFGSTRPFDVSAYVGCVVARLRSSTSLPADRVRVIEILSLDPNFLAALLLESDAAESDIQSGTVRAYFARHPRSGAPWTLLSDSEQRALTLIEDVSVRLDTIAYVPQGIRTGGNDLFVFDIDSFDGSRLCKATNGLGESVVLEVDLLEQVVYGSEVKRYEAVKPIRRLLYPYRNNVALSEAVLESQYPHTWAYLLRNRDLLAARASLKKSGGKFYQLVWPRNESWLRRPKLLIRDLSPCTAFALDSRGEAFLVGGTAVVPQQPDHLVPLLAYLNSSVIDGLIRHSTPQFRGDFQKFEPQHIEGVPVLDRLIEDVDFAGRLSGLAMEVIEARVQGLEPVAVDREAEIDSLIVQIASDRGITLE